MTTESLCEGCRREPATAVDQWTGMPVGENCARISRRVQTTQLTARDVEEVLRDAVIEDSESYTGYQNSALEQLANLLVYQQQRIAALEAAVAKLTKGDA